MLAFRAFSLLIIAALSLGQAPLHYVLDAKSSNVTAKVAFFGLASKTARFPKMDGTVSIVPDVPSDAHIEVTLDATALEAPDEVTLKRLRGEKFFWVEKYPRVRFVGHKLTMSDATHGSLEGKLTARGITRDETLQVRFDQSPADAPPGTVLTINGEMEIDRRDYGMTAYRLIVGKTVTIRLQARMVPR